MDGARKDASETNKDEQIKRLEEKLDKYSILLKEAVKSKEKMEATLMSHEEGTFTENLALSILMYNISNSQPHCIWQRVEQW